MLEISIACKPTKFDELFKHSDVHFGTDKILLPSNDDSKISKKGNYPSEYNLGSISYNYDPSSGQANSTINLGPSSSPDLIQCVNCYFIFSSNVNIDFSTSYYLIESFNMALNNTLNVNIALQFNQTYAYSSSNDIELIQDATFGQLSFTIWFSLIPITFSIQLPVHGGYTLQFNEQAMVSSLYSLFAESVTGLQWNTANGFSPIQQFSWQQQFQPPKTSVTGDLTVITYLQPTIKFGVDAVFDVGSLEVDLIFKPYLELQASYSLQPFSDDRCSGGFPNNGDETWADLGWGYDVSVGANFDFLGLTKDFGPYLLYSKQPPYELWKTCASPVDLLEFGAPITSYLPSNGSIVGCDGNAGSGLVMNECNICGASNAMCPGKQYSCLNAPNPASVGNGFCDDENNYAPCYDGGDCCQQTCQPTLFACLNLNDTCIDPTQSTNPPLPTLIYVDSISGNDSVGNGYYSNPVQTLDYAINNILSKIDPSMGPVIFLMPFG